MSNNDDMYLAVIESISYLQQIESMEQLVETARHEVNQTYANLLRKGIHVYTAKGLHHVRELSGEFEGRFENEMDALVFVASKLMERK